MSPSPKPTDSKPHDPGDSAKYKDGPFDHIDAPALVSFVLCLLGLFLLLTWVRSLDGRHFGSAGDEGPVERVARLLTPPKMAFVTPLADVPRPVAKAPSSRPKPAAVDPTARARIERSKRAVVEHVEEVRQTVKRSGLMAILSAQGGGKGQAVTGMGSRLNLKGLGGLGAKLNGLEGLTRFGDPSTSRADHSAEPEFASVDKPLKGFDNAKRGALSKIGSAELDKPERLDKGRRYANARNVQELHAVINRRQSAVRLLYEERLRTRPDLEGKVTLMLVIEEDGSVSQVTILQGETTIDDPELLQDIMRTVKRWIFPAFTGGAVELKTPFVLKPR
jgi:hypothetical protein